jgi:hypothetical protein
MKSFALFNAAMIAGVLLAPASAEGKAKNSADARIPFVNHGGIRDWMAPDDHTLYIQGTGNRWFKAETMGTCQGLRFADRVGFDTGAVDTFDRFSSIVVRGQKCQISSLVQVPGPPSGKGKHHKTKSKG